MKYKVEPIKTLFVILANARIWILSQVFDVSLRASIPRSLRLEEPNRLRMTGEEGFEIVSSLYDVFRD